MSSRQAILEKIRAGLQPGDGEASESLWQEQREKNVAVRLRTHKRGIMPGLPKSRPALAKRFIEKAEASGASLAVTKTQGLSREITRFLSKHDLPLVLRCGADKRLQKLRAHKRSRLKFTLGKAEPDDMTGLVFAEAGIAETGTLAVLSGKKNPVTLNYLPPNQIILVRHADIVAHYEDVFDRLRQIKGKGQSSNLDLPRSLGFITGPSRSADIEQTLIMGAHGPVRLHIILVKE